MYLGGPLTFMSELRACFDKVLSVKGVLPENSLYFVAMGAALLAKKDKAVSLSSIMDKVSKYRNDENFAYLSPLFASKEEYDAFVTRHNKDIVPSYPLEGMLRMPASCKVFRR